MNVLENVLLIVHLLVAVAVCGFVLLQHGKGADMGAAFGSGSSGSLFGAAGSANFLSRTTAVLATVFFLSSLGLTWFGTTHVGTGSVIPQGVMDKLPPPKASDIPPAPAGAAPAGPADAAKSATPAAPAPATAAPAPSSTAPGTPAPAGAGSKSGDVPK